MEEKKCFLYGAAVQGIQSYIFQTNKLQDIIGASELVRKICTDLFKDTVGSSYKESNKIIAAAGNIKYVFDSRSDCECVVKSFPKRVINTAPGATISQAVVEYSDNDEYQSKVNELEGKLRIQRNRPMKSTAIGYLGTMRSRSTGLPVVEVFRNEYLDASTMKKRAEQTMQRLCIDAFGTNVSDRSFAYDVEDMCDKNNWLAIIHADGNGFGKIVQEVGKNKEDFKKFSESLDNATKTAAQKAFVDVIPKEEWSDVIPIRPIVIGGDDFTVICRGTMAMDFVTSYLKHFEEETSSQVGRKLTVCAGVAFIKSGYPFYYGYNLAEALCNEAKKEAKKVENMDGSIVRSCLMFHKVQDSFITEYSDIEKRELTPTAGWSYKHGPYYLERFKDNMTIDELLEYPQRLEGKEGNALKSGLRRWMTCLSADGEHAAEQLYKRIEQISSSNMQKILKELIVKRAKVTPVYDVLALCSIINKETNN